MGRSRRCALVMITPGWASRGLPGTTRQPRDALVSFTMAAGQDNSDPAIACQFVAAGRAVLLFSLG